MTSHTLARTAVRIAGLALTRDRSADHQCFRVKNLHADEVVQFVDSWPTIAQDSRLETVKLVVADSLGGRIAHTYVSEPGCSITHYRNNNRNGLVYVETSVQSDEQGLQNMFSLRDSNFLDGSFDDYAMGYRGVAGLLIAEAWRSEGGIGDAPGLLLDRLLLVLRLVHPDIEPVPVRRFVAFVELACNLWINSKETIDGSAADRIVGQCLWAMDMFPDSKWHEGDADARCRRRLELNARYSDLIDGSTEMDGEVVAAKAQATRFVDDSGQSLSATETEQWRARCASYALGPTPERRKEIPYSIFSQLFARDTVGLPLGDRVRAEIAIADPSRAEEFESLDVTSGLNVRNSHEAGRFLEAVPPQGYKALPDLLSPATRKVLERVAVPPKKKFFNPAIEIVRTVQRVRSEPDRNRIAKIQISLAQEGSAGSPSHGLFVFLFGETLKSVAENLSGRPGSCEVVFEGAFGTAHPVPELRGVSENDEDEPQDITWDPLPLRIKLLDAESRVIEVVEQIEWCHDQIDYFALLWLLAAAPESPYFEAIGTLKIAPPTDGNDWLAPIVRREISLETFNLDTANCRREENALIDELIMLRTELRSGLVSKGLDVTLLGEFVDRWQAVLERAREEFVPDGVRGRELEAFLGCDMLDFDGANRRLMLALHPIRLRWICGYLQETRKLAEAFLSDETAFADGEGELYLDWLENLTPSESPPVAIGHNGALLYSRSEIAWCEDFSLPEAASGDLAFDNLAITAIAQRIGSYLDAHPYKRDGLSLLLVLPSSDAVPAEILRRIAVRANRSVRVSLHVAVPRDRWESIARSIEQLSAEADTAPRSRLFPDRDLTLIDYQAGDDMADLLSGLQLDMAVVTHLLQEQIVSQQNTEVNVERPGSYDPLRHRPLRLETGDGGSAISVVMLPRYPDPVLESWSTLAVRANRCKPVAPGQPQNTDLVELRVNFQDSARLFLDLHKHCHWVITLERHISREQIESVEAGAPDILSIEEGVGVNGHSTLVVSSRSGRDLIHSRLVRKLQRLIPAQQQEVATGKVLSELASGIYDSTRRLSPKLALQALGVARVTEEIVGLTVARRLAEIHAPIVLRQGLSAWLSLDEHSEWFGGPGQVRADMCRISLSPDEAGAVDIDVLVLEGKLRQLYDGHGVAQVKRTCDFFRKILDADGAATKRKVDAAMWRELVAGAIETVAEEAVTVVLPAEATIMVERSRYRDSVLSDFRAGRFRMRSIRGIYSACLWDNDRDSITETEIDGVTVLQSTRVHLLDLVRARPIAQESASEVDATEDYQSPVGKAALGEAGDAPYPEMTEIAPTNRGIKGSLRPGAPINLTADALVGRTVTTAGHEPKAEAHEPVTSLSGIPGDKKRGLSDSELRRMYEVILGCFDMHGIDVVAAAPADQPIIEGPASVMFKVRPGPGVDPKKLNEKAAALKLDLGLDQEQNVSFSIDRGFVTVDVPKRPEQRYFVDAGDSWRRWSRPAAALAVPIGEDRFGNLVELNFSSPNSPHLLVAGTTGSGKSEALNTILFGLVRNYSKDELRLMLVDPKGTELAPFEGSAYLEGRIGWEDTDAVRLLRAAVGEMERRYALFRVASQRSISDFNATAAPIERLPWWVIVLDEYADLTHDQQAKKEIEAELRRLAQKARAAGIHVIIATQKPSAEVISTNLRSNLPAQLALRVKSATESRVVIDEAGAENLNGIGDALLKADGKLRRVQCSRVDPADRFIALGGPTI
jgi:S-DNA-T family DNA segregation ATPase FtsK/SpoIIIE